MGATPTRLPAACPERRGLDLGRRPRGEEERSRDRHAGPGLVNRPHGGVRSMDAWPSSPNSGWALAAARAKGGSILPARVADSRNSGRVGSMDYLGLAIIAGLAGREKRSVMLSRWAQAGRRAVPPCSAAAKSSTTAARYPRYRTRVARRRPGNTGETRGTRSSRTAPG